MMAPFNIISFIIILVLLISSSTCAKIDDDDDSSEESVVKKLPYLQRFNSKQRARPESGTLTPRAETDCTAINFASVSKCCRTPLGDVFTAAEMTSCNGKVTDDTVFKWVRDYNENSLLQPDASFDYVNSKFSRTIASAACMVECLFKNFNLLGAGGLLKYEDLKNFLPNRTHDEWDGAMDEIVDQCRDDVIKILKQKTITQGGTTCVLEPLVMFQCIRRIVPEFCPDGSLDSLPLCSKDKELLKKCTPEKIRGNSTQAHRLVSTPGCLLDPAEIARCVYKHFPQNCFDAQQKILPDCGGKNRMEFSRCLGGISATIATNNEHRIFLNTTNENVYRARMKRKWTTNHRG